MLLLGGVSFLSSSVFWGGAALALMAGPIGSFLVWGRMAFLADVLAHAALLGSVIVSLTVFSLSFSFLAFAVTSASLLFVLIHFFQDQQEVVLVLFSTSFMALGLVIMHVYDLSTADLIGYLTGRGTPPDQFLWVVFLAVLVTITCFLIIYWRALLSIVIAPELAAVEGVRQGLLTWIFMVLVFLFIFLGIRWSGALFMTAFLVCPLLIVRPWCCSPLSVLCFSGLMGGVSFSAGFWLVSHLGWPQGPTFTLVMVAGVMLSHLLVYVRGMLKSVY